MIRAPRRITTSSVGRVHPSTDSPGDQTEKEQKGARVSAQKPDRSPDQCLQGKPPGEMLGRMVQIMAQPGENEQGRHRMNRQPASPRVKHVTNENRRGENQD